MATERSGVTLTGVVATTIESPHAGEPGKATISIEAADDLYREIRIENTLKNKDGGEVRLKPGAEVRITIKAGQPATMAKTSNRLLKDSFRESKANPRR